MICCFLTKTLSEARPHSGEKVTPARRGPRDCNRRSLNGLQEGGKMTFLIGLLVGTAAGIFIAALLKAAKTGTETYQTMYEALRELEKENRN